jgi:2'-5' RNA ligase
MATRRIFAAIDIPDDVRLAVSEYIAGQKSKFRDLPIKWEKAEKLHITLKFVAEADERQAEALDRSIGEVANVHSAFDAAIDGTGAFPNFRSPRVLWLGVGTGAEQMEAIARGLESICESEGIPREKKRFHPHLTIGRFRQFGRKAVDLGALSQFGPEAFRVERLTLYESSLSPTGSTYTVLSRHDLNGVT